MKDTDNGVVFLHPTGSFGMGRQFPRRTVNTALHYSASFRRTNSTRTGFNTAGNRRLRMFMRPRQGLPPWWNVLTEVIQRSRRTGRKNMENSLPCRKCILVVDLAHFHSSYMCARRKKYASKTPPYAFPTCIFSSFCTTTRAKRLNLWKTPSQLCNQLWI